MQITLKVQGTPGSALMEAQMATLGNRLGAEQGQTKFVEMGGKQITAGLSKSVNFRGNQGCVFTPKCNVDPEEDCRNGRVVYEVECMNCTRDPATVQKALYFGTSGHLLHKRQLEHIGEVRRGLASNALSKHHTQVHQNQNLDPDFRSRPLRGGIRYNLDRFILEANKIEQGSQNQSIKTENLKTLNLKSGFFEAI